MIASSATHTQRASMIALLLRVRTIVYVAVSIPVVISPYGTPAARAFTFSAVILAGVGPLLARRLMGWSAVRTAATCDLVVSFGIWLFIPAANGIALMLTMWAIALAVLLDTKNTGIAVAVGATAIQILKLVFLLDPMGVERWFPTLGVAASAYIIVGSTAGLWGAYTAFVIIGRYIGRLQFAPETSEQRYRSLMDTAPLAFLVVLNDTVVYANAAAARLFGGQSTDMFGLTITNHVSDDSRKTFKRVINGVLKRFEPVDRETVHMTALDGTELVVEISANPVDHGNRLAVQLILLDKTAQHHAEEQLRKTRIDYQKFFERIPVALYRTQPDGRIVNVNQAAVELLGADSRESIIGTNASDYYVDRSNRDQLSTLLDNEGVVAGYEWQMRRHDGTYRWVRDTSRLLETPAGRFFEGAMVDVTTRRDVEDELWARAIQQEAAASVGQLALETEDVDAVCETLSDIVCEVLGASTVAVVRRDEHAHFVVVGSTGGVSPDASLLSSVADRAHMSAAPVVLRSEAEMRFVAPQLSERGYSSCVALMIPGKEIDFGTLVVLSRSERVFSTDDLNFLYSIANVLAAAFDRASAYERLEALVKSKDAFVASVSHELRTPLTVVSGLAHELAQCWQTLSDAEMEEFMGMLVGQSLDMADLIEDLLVAARANIGNVSVQIVPVDIAREVDNVMLGVARQTDKSISVKVEPASIEADPTRFRQILRNLLSNALRYGGDTIELVGSSRSGVYAIEVRDSGEPISMRDRERIFEPYERAHNTAGRPGSVGLGLSVSRTLAELMQGSLTYHHDGQSVFRLELPGEDDLEAAPPSGVRRDQTLRSVGAVGAGRVGVDVGSVQ